MGEEAGVGGLAGVKGGGEAGEGGALGGGGGEVGAVVGDLVVEGGPLLPELVGVAELIFAGAGEVDIEQSGLIGQRQRAQRPGIGGSGLAADALPLADEGGGGIEAITHLAGEGDLAGDIGLGAAGLGILEQAEVLDQGLAGDAEADGVDAGRGHGAIEGEVEVPGAEAAAGGGGGGDPGGVGRGVEEQGGVGRGLAQVPNEAVEAGAGGAAQGADGVAGGVEDGENGGAGVAGEEVVEDGAVGGRMQAG